MLVALAASTAAAWLTLRQANGQVQDTVNAGQQDVSRITAGLRAYGYAHGGWDGVSSTVGALSRATGQRVRVATETGALLADSDALAGRDPRPLGSRPPALVDARPELRLPTGPVPLASVKRTATAIADYRRAVAYAACLTREGAEVSARPDASGLPRISTDSRTTACGGQAPAVAPPTPQDIAAVSACGSAEAVTPCLQRVFQERTAAVAPERLEVRFGFRDERAPALAVAPAVELAVGTALCAILGALLLSRAVLRPVRAMTLAAKAVGEGDLGRRVPVSGRDEIAQLGGAFNRMADSLQAGEDRQRRFTSDIAHELRTPLANLRGYLEALKDGVVEPTPELLASLHDETLLQQRIVDDLQDLVLAEAGALTYHRGEVDLRDLLDASRTAHRTRAETASVTLELAAPAEHLTAFPPAEVTLPWLRQDGPPVTRHLYFTGAELGPLRRNDFNTHVWKPSLAAAGVIPTPGPGERYKEAREDGMHALRHFYASVLLDAGESIKAVSAYLGHADPGFTLRTYTHLMPTSETRTRKAVDGVFRKARKR